MLVNPGRILVAGDCHHDIDHLRYLCQVALENSCDCIYQVGDLSYMPHTEIGTAFLDEISHLMWEYNLWFFWHDGNHENFDALWGTEWPITSEGFYRMGPRFFYVPRGLRWVWAGLRFLALGGAHSSDIFMRKRMEARSGLPRTWWWPQEDITQQDYYRALGGGGRVDVMLTHDAPLNVSIPGFDQFRRYGLGAQNRQAIQDIADTVSPYVLYHGHLHKRYTSQLTLPNRACVVEGLGANGQGPESWAILDIGNLREQHGI